MLDHFGFRIRDLARSRHFYEAALRPLGLDVIDNTATSFLICRSADGAIPFVWVGTDEPRFWTGHHAISASPIHLAFTAADREEVDLFHAVGTANGGEDNGHPGWRGPKDADIYAAYLIDPDGNNVEAIYRG